MNNFLVIFVINQLIVWPIKSLKIVKNVHEEFPEPNVMFSCIMLRSHCDSEPKQIQFSAIEEKTMKTFFFSPLLVHFCNLFNIIDFPKTNK